MSKEIRSPLILVYRAFREMQPHDMPHLARKVLGAVADRLELGDDGRITGWISLWNIQKAAGAKSLSAVKECRAALIERGWLVMTQKGGGDDATHYEIPCERVDPKANGGLPLRFTGRMWAKDEPTVGRVRRATPAEGGPAGEGGRHAAGEGAATRPPGGLVRDPEGAATRPGGGRHATPKDHYEDHGFDHRLDPYDDQPSSGRARADQGPSLTPTGEAILAALTAGYGDPPEPVLQAIATRNLAHQIAGFSCEDGHTGTRHTADLVHAIREAAGKERTAAPGQGRVGRELREFVFGCARGIRRGAAAAAAAREGATAGPGVAATRATVVPIKKHPAWVGRGGVGGHGQTL
ncbi:MAG: hypothetical protein EKK55_18105 [Rhodocyclaceae bacterium]|nr:MAG: hypothetical protein EKK55_18105 [Rhodocyclaceae bacterium]